MPLGNRINEIRKKKKISIDELCERSGIPKGTLSKITAGITTNPTLDTVRAIAKALECRLDDFDDQPLRQPLDYSEEESCMIKKYRTLDGYGKEAVDAILDIECKRVQSHTILVVARGGGVQHIYDENADTLEHDISQIPQTDEEF